MYPRIRWELCADSSHFGNECFIAVCRTPYLRSPYFISISEQVLGFSVWWRLLCWQTETRL